MKELLESKIQEVLLDLGIKDVLAEVSSPKDPINGDFSSSVALKLSKALEKSPLEIAELIKKNLKSESFIERVEVAKPGFLNFYIDNQYYKNLLNTFLQNPDFYKSEWGKGKKWLIEHTSPNPNKAMHLGHLRNNLTGMAVSNLAKAVGVEVIMDCVDNNRGIAIAKLMWGYLKFANKDSKKRVEDLNYWFNNQAEWLTPIDLNVSPDKFMDNLYVKGSEDFKDQEVQTKVRQLVIDWESEDKITWALWQKVLDYVYLGQQKTLNRINSHWDYVWHEHEHYKEGKDIVEDGLKKGIFKKIDDGAVITDLKEFKIPDTILIKRDGTSLYITQDLALTKKKIEKFSPDKLFWVIGPEQSLAMKQVFCVSTQLGFGNLENFIHLPYGFISIKGQGKMSSRAGNTIYVDDLIDEAASKVFNKITSENFSDEEKKVIAEKVGIAAIKYSILKVGRLTDTAFDFETSLSFDGDSAPYLLYSYARAFSIIKQFNKSISNLDLKTEILDSVEEIELIKLISKFKETILDSAISYSQNILCEYLFDLCQSFNKFYGKHSILNSLNSNIKESRVALITVFSSVLQHGLNILGIETLESM